MKLTMMKAKSCIPDDIEQESKLEKTRSQLENAESLRQLYVTSMQQLKDKVVGCKRKRV